MMLIIAIINDLIKKKNEGAENRKRPTNYNSNPRNPRKSKSRRINTNHQATGTTNKRYRLRKTKSARKRSSSSNNNNNNGLNSRRNSNRLAASRFSVNGRQDSSLMNTGSNFGLGNLNVKN